MSSSAALEVSAGFAFAEAFGIELPKAEWAKIGQGVENNYMGLNSGLLDQFSSIFGKDHNTPAFAASQAGPFDQWPTGMGFEYFVITSYSIHYTKLYDASGRRIWSGQHRRRRGLP